jgi:hypothetical protein
MPDGALVTVPPPVLLTVSVGSAAKAGETSRVRAASPSSRVRVVATMRRVPLLPYTVVSNVPSSYISVCAFCPHPTGRASPDRYERRYEVDPSHNL